MNSAHLRGGNASGGDEEEEEDEEEEQQIQAELPAEGSTRSSGAKQKELTRLTSEGLMGFKL